MFFANLANLLMKSFCVAFFRKAWWRVNVFLLSSISDATLMLDFCEVQHLKLNLSAALGRARRRETISTFLFCQAFFLRLRCQRKKRAKTCMRGLVRMGKAQKKNSWRDTLIGVSRQFYSPLASIFRQRRNSCLRSDIRLTPSEYFAKGEIPLRELERRIEYH